MIKKISESKVGQYYVKNDIKCDTNGSEKKEIE